VVLGRLDQRRRTRLARGNSSEAPVTPGAPQMPTMEIIPTVVNGRALRSKPADPPEGRVRQTGPAHEWPSMPPPIYHRRTVHESPHPRTRALRHPSRPRAPFLPQQKRCRFDVPSLIPCALMKCERRTRTPTLAGHHHLPRQSGRSIVVISHADAVGAPNRVILPAGHLATYRSEFGRSQQTARHRKQILVFNGNMPVV
jgi:hypothetical protein